MQVDVRLFGKIGLTIGAKHTFNLLEDATIATLTNIIADKIGQKRGWIVTGGSDFHGGVKPHISLGQSWVDEETFQHLYQHYLRVNADV